MPRNQYLIGFVLGCTGLVFQLPHDIHALQNAAEHHVFPVQVRRRDGRDEKLRSVGVRTGISHRQETRDVMLQGGALDSHKEDNNNLAQVLQHNQQRANQHTTMFDWVFPNIV